MKRHNRFTVAYGVILSLALILSATSCSSVDMDEVMEKATEIAGGVEEVVRDALDEDDSGSSGGQPAGTQPEGGQTVSRPPRPTGTLTVGAETPLASASVSPSGGTVRVERPGDALDGLEIQVPGGAYGDARQFDISSAPVSNHSFGEYFTPATPLISIENGGEYSEEFMTARIPIELPPDHFAMAFYYDEAAGTLEGIPFKSLEGDSITIVTRHFCDIIVSIINNTLLDDLMKADIDSHFRPGIDDWQFTNYGSYIAKGGHCAGQCLTALWYFCEQPDGKDLTLNGRYDKNGVYPPTPKLWEDDSHGYRYASTIQKDINWSSFENKLMTALAGKDDELTYKAFAYSIQLTGEPQEIGIFSSAGGGHDMICYRITKGSLYIADPNYFGNTERRIEFENGRFKPYESGANAAEIAAGNSKTYETIAYCAKSATINWQTLGARWNEFKAGTIGNDRFPQYQVVVQHDDGTGEPLSDGFVSEQKKIRLNLKANIPLGWSTYKDGQQVTVDTNGKFELADGNNLVGIAVFGDVNNNPQNRKWKYIDFQYYDIQYGEEDKECSGWVLDSVDVLHTFGGVDTAYEQYVQPFQHGNGSYSYAVREVVRDLSPGQPGGEIYSTCTTSGSWTPPPDCLRSDEPIRVELHMQTSVQAPPVADAPDWDGCRIILLCNMVGSLDQTVTRETPSLDESTVVELYPFGEGTASYREVSIEVELAGYVECTYRYNYVWQG